MVEEYAFISCLLNRPELFDRVVARVKPEYITTPKCEIIYNKMVELGDFSLPMLVKELEGQISFKELMKIAEGVAIPTKSTIDGYAFCIIEDYKKREVKKLISSGNIDDISARIDDIKQIHYFEEKEVDESVEFLKNVEDRYSGRDDKRCVKTGYDNIDSQIDGFRKSELIILGGRPASGKTTFGMNIAFMMAKHKYKVLFCSLEMGRIELHERINKSVTKINNYKSMTESDFNKVVEASRFIKDLPLKIYDKAGMTIENIVYQAKQGSYDIIFIDHLSILKSVKSFKSRYEEVSYLSARLKVLARELDIPVVCLCQLNRGLEGRDIKAPTMADLRDSGSIEQDADLVSFVYRPEYHLKDKEPDDKNSKEYTDWQIAMKQVKGKAMLILAKNRRGYIGRFKFEFDGANYSFYDRG